jgi:hypothetical protein
MDLMDLFQVRVWVEMCSNVGGGQTKQRIVQTRETMRIAPETRYVKSVCMIHVGGTRCVTSSTDNILNIHFRITLTVEFIRGYIFKCLFYV